MSEPQHLTPEELVRDADIQDAFLGGNLRLQDRNRYRPDREAVVALLRPHCKNINDRIARCRRAGQQPAWDFISRDVALTAVSCVLEGVFQRSPVETTSHITLRMLGRLGYRQKRPQGYKEFYKDIQRCLRCLTRQADSHQAVIDNAQELIGTHYSAPQGAAR